MLSLDAAACAVMLSPTTLTSVVLLLTGGKTITAAIATKA
jgi:hypothetical protein